MMKFISIAILLSVATSARGDNAASDVKDDLRSLCSSSSASSSSDKQPTFELTRRSQLSGLVAALAEVPECPQRTRLALVELNQLVGNDNVCSPNNVNQIRDFYMKHIDIKQQQQQQQQSSSDDNGSDSSSSSSKPLPKSVVTFFLAYSLQVSSLCKKNMITSLMYDTKELLNEDDYKRVDPFVSESSLIGKIMNEPSDYDDLILPKDLARLFNGAGGAGETEGRQPEEDSKLILQTMTGDVINKLQLICSRRFRPLYESLILPLVTLSNIGINYQGEELKYELKEMSTNKELHKWYRIVYLCETISNIEIVPFDANGDNQLEDRRLVRILTREEAAAATAASKGKQDQSKANEEENNNSNSSLEQIHYNLDEYKLQLGADLIVDKTDHNLMQLIGRFAAHKSELDRIRGRLMRKLGSFLKEFIRSGKINFVGSLVFSKLRSASGSAASSSAASLNDDLVKTIDDFVAQMSPASGNRRDEPVAGFGTYTGGVAKRYYQNAAYQGFRGMSGKAQNALQRAGYKKVFWYFIAVCCLIAGILTLAFG